MEATDVTVVFEDADIWSGEMATIPQRGDRIEIQPMMMSAGLSPETKAMWDGIVRRQFQVSSVQYAIGRYGTKTKYHVFVFIEEITT